jgi:hypothetical protein
MNPFRFGESAPASLEELEPGEGGVTEAELVEWIVRNGPEIARRWKVELRARAPNLTGEMAELVDRFLDLLVAILPPAVGPWRGQVEPVLQHAAHLYGSIGSLRGLAAGEVVEEMQILREVVLRFLYRDPPHDQGGGLALRELLRLNRIVDRMVTHANVGHIDALFFNLLHGTGGAAGVPGRETLDELRSEMEVIRGELKRIRPVGGRGGFVPSRS